jgi:UDP-glucose 4-epimerase
VITVAITGVSGLIGRRVLDAMLAARSVDRVVGLDLVAPEAVDTDRFSFHRVDVTDADAVAAALEEVDVVVHLAFRMDPMDDLDRMRRINVDGTRHVVEAAARVGAHRVVYASSVTAYGAHPDNDVPLTEESPLRANPDFAYVEHKRDVERWLDQWEADHPDVTVARLRLAMVVGTGADNSFIRALLGPRLPSVRGHRPPFQLVHVDDVTTAVVHAVEHDLAGAYNVAAEGWLSFDELSAILGRRALDIPEEVAFTTVERLAAFGLSELPVGAVHYLMHPWVVSADRLVATGWRPQHSNRDAAAHLAAELGDRLVLGPVSTSRHHVRQAAAVSAGVAGGLLALGVLARRRSRPGRDEA